VASRESAGTAWPAGRNWREEPIMDDYDVYAPFYDLEFGDRGDDLLVIEQFAARCGSPILELACGTGRVLLPLARQGYQVTGVDVSAGMLDVARRKVTEEDLDERVTLVQQDMRHLALEERFALAVIAVNSFMHLRTPDDQLEVLARIRAHLQPGGLLYLDLFNPDLGLLLDMHGQVFLDKVMVHPETGHRLMRFRSQQADLGQQTISVTYMVDELDDDGRTRRTLFPFHVRYLFRAELEHLISRAGLALEAIYGSYDLDGWSGESDRMVTVARRPD
jgi:SAM-dependent methyltransferase